MQEQKLEHSKMQAQLAETARLRLTSMAKTWSITINSNNLKVAHDYKPELRIIMHKLGAITN